MRLSTLSIAAALLGLCQASPVPGVNIANLHLDPSHVVPGSYIVVYKASASDADITAHENDVHAKLGKGPTTKYKIAGFQGYHIETDATGLAKFGAASVIDYVEQDSKSSVTPTLHNTTKIDGLAPVANLLTSVPTSDWGLGRISHRARYNFNYIYDTSACSNTFTYIFDTGILTTHQEFGGRALWGANFISGSPNTDENGHGTHVAGTVAGTNVGVCKKGTVIAVKVLDKTGSGTMSGLMSGMAWALSNTMSRGVSFQAVFSMSLSGPSTAAVNAYANAIFTFGIPIIAAAGNNAADAGYYSPGGAPGVFAVGATDVNDAIASFSNFGIRVPIFAPGVTILSAYGSCNTCYAYYSGTSQATPHVSGLVAYYKTLKNLFNPMGLYTEIIMTATSGTITGTLNSANNMIAYNGDGY